MSQYSGVYAHSSRRLVVEISDFLIHCYWNRRIGTSQATILVSLRLTSSTAEYRCRACDALCHSNTVITSISYDNKPLWYLYESVYVAEPGLITNTSFVVSDDFPDGFYCRCLSSESICECKWHIQACTDLTAYGRHSQRPIPTHMFFPGGYIETISTCIAFITFAPCCDEDFVRGQHILMT